MLARKGLQLKALAFPKCRQALSVLRALVGREMPAISEGSVNF